MLALLLAMASLGYIALAWLQQEYERLPLAIVGGSAVVLLIGAALPSSPRRWRWLFAGAAVLYWMMILGALGLQFNEEKPLVVRATLVGLLMAGLLLSLRAGFLARRRPTYGFQNYYDMRR